MLEALGRLVLASWHVVGILLLAVLALEYGVGGWRRLSRWLRYRRAMLPDSAARSDAYRDADWAVAYFDEFNRAVRVDWRAYVGWWQRPFRGAYVTLDARGLRPTPGEERAAAGATRILCFGGSTMMGMGARDGHTIAAVLARRLDELGHTVAVTNYGQLGHNSTQALITLQQLLKAGRPVDVAVFYDGVNDMAAAEQVGRAGGPLNEARRQAEFNLLIGERRRELLTAALLQALPRTVRRLRWLTGAALRGPLPVPEADLSRVDLIRLAADVVDVYAANLRIVRLLADEYGFRPLFFWQPVITTKRTKSADEQRFEADHTRDVAIRRALFAATIAEYRRRGLADAADTVDLSALFDELTEPVYIDMAHLSEAGNAAVAEAMLLGIATLLRGPG